MDERDLDRETPYLLALLRNTLLPPESIARLHEACGGYKAIFEATGDELRAQQISPRQLKGLRNPDWAGVDRDLRWLEQQGNQIISRESANYPRSLREIPDPPAALFARGDPAVLATVQLAVVGTRCPSADGRRLAAELAGSAADCGITVTSGLALGIDAQAHCGALDAGGSSVAVLGNGLATVYPERHRRLAARVAGRGALVTEFPTDYAPLPENFPRRNRIISGLSVGVLVVEAALRSGSLITARHALEQGREVFAVPGSVRNPRVRGCHALIRQGAKLVERIEDILEEIEVLASFVSGSPARGSGETDPEKALDARSKLLLDNIGYQPVSIDFLVESTDLPVPVGISLLSKLEIAGLIESLPGGNFVRR